MTQKIRPEVPCLKKPWNSIHNQLNVEILTWKNNINYIKDPKQKKMKNKRIEIQKKIIFYWTVKLKKNN
jgi:putative cell wall-binding protein